jgi:hypothetical protein
VEYDFHLWRCRVSQSEVLFGLDVLEHVVEESRIHFCDLEELWYQRVNRLEVQCEVAILWNARCAGLLSRWLADTDLNAPAWNHLQRETKCFGSCESVRPYPGLTDTRA